MRSNWIKDDRSNCWSAMTKITVSEYLELVDDAHKNRGGLEGQRDVLKSTTAKRIRERMISDIAKGALLPPVVLGVVMPPDEFVKITPSTDVVKLLKSGGNGGQLSIIDGMQRTASIKEALEENPNISDNEMRVEFWVTDNVRAMIYRMLVLNTGQIPWTVARQLEVIYGPLIEEIRQNVEGIEKVADSDNRSRRVGAGQYAAKDLAELYIAFSLRKTAVDQRDAISNEFARLDFVENLSEGEFQEKFYRVLRLMVQFDHAFSCLPATDGESVSGRFIFDSQPARVGFVVAMGLFILGRPGGAKSEAEQVLRIEKIETLSAELTSNMEAMQEEELREFLALGVLEQMLGVRSSQVGRYHRSLFQSAFAALIEDEFEVPSMEQCWRAVDV